jgi:phosphatidylserine/phosphatidylglycerophosphate/cardiolipin synthase-like enzyme
MITFVKNPYKNEFMEMIRESNHKIVLCAPFIKQTIVDEILKNKKESTEVTIITNSSLPNFVRESSDIEAIEKLLDNGIDVYNYQSLHAKIYTFDDNKVFITSANLTYNGLNKNYEYGVLISNEKEIERIFDDIDNMYLSDLCGEFKKEEINYIKKTVANIKKNSRVVSDNNGESLIIVESLNPIIKNITSVWQKDILSIIECFQNEVFELHDLYKFIPELSKDHPNNNHIDAKIRQTLQQLRDKGLVKFVEPGVYKKLFVSEM